MTAIPIDPRELARQIEADLAAQLDLVERLRIVSASLTGRIAFSTSLGLEDQAILNGIAAADTERIIDVFTLDTGRLFPETVELVSASTAHFDRHIAMYAPDASDVEALVDRDGALGFRSSVEARKACCAVRKVAPLRRALKGASAWITGLRREQSAGRAHVPFAAWDPDHLVIKINPIADWDHAKLRAYIEVHDIPINPLHAKGFPSIGCHPCTRAIAPGEDIRSGRWWWENADGKECGLHRSPGRLRASKPVDEVVQ